MHEFTPAVEELAAEVLKYSLERLKDDHERAKQIAAVLSKVSWVKAIMPVDTNIVVFEVPNKIGYQNIIQQLNEQGVLTAAFGPGQVRLVTHLDFTDQMLAKTVEILKKMQ